MPVRGFEYDGKSHMHMSVKQKIIILAGPTGSGKTRLGIRLAREFDGEIISVDSRQIYRHMDIGTAKPNHREQCQAPHHMLDIVNPHQTYSAGDFGRLARSKVAELADIGKTPILVGGAGLYLQAVLDGLRADCIDHAEIRANLRRDLRQYGVQSLYARLVRLDPPAAARLEVSDKQRIVRSLEFAIGDNKSVQISCGKRGSKPLNCVPIGFCIHWPRGLLYNRINTRVDNMLQAGWINEVQTLLSHGYDRKDPGLQTFGYSDILDHLDGQKNLADTAASIKRRTRQYAKRQLTWFRRDRRLYWLSLDRWGEEGVFERMKARIRTYGL